MGKKNERSLRRMQGDLAHHRADRENTKARKAAGKLRRDFNKDKGGERNVRLTEDNWEELLDQHGKARRRAQLSDVIEQLEPSHADDAAGSSDTPSGIVISISSARARVFFEEQELDCLVPPHIAMKRGSALAAGDRVLVASEEGVWRVESVLPRRSVLARPDPINRHLQRMIAANIDVVVHVVSVKSPPLRPRLVDRVLIAIQRGNAGAVICVNKVDLLTGEERAAEFAKLDVYRSLDVPVIPVSTRTGEGLDELRVRVEGRMAAMVGHSGVGKSSILNALDERLQLVTNTLHRRGTGRHTTTRATLYDFGGGTYLIDTPGIREFGLWDLDRETLRDYFPEFAEPSESCRFTNCTHVHEPDCEVKRLVEEGELNEGRYDTYVRLYESMAAA